MIFSVVRYIDFSFKMIASQLICKIRRRAIGSISAYPVLLQIGRRANAVLRSEGLVGLYSRVKVRRDEPAHSVSIQMAAKQIRMS